MTKRTAFVLLLLACTAIGACVTTYRTTQTTAARVDSWTPHHLVTTAGVPSPEPDALVASPCPGGCNPDVYVCNPVARRCVGNGSPAINLCKWGAGVSGTALACGASDVTTVDSCHDPKNCGNCGVACASGRCFWGACE